MCLKKRIADLLEITFGDADSAIGDAEHEFVALDAAADDDAAILAAELDRVRDEIEHDLPHRPLVRDDFGQRRGEFDREANAFLLGIERHDPDAGFDQCRDRKGFWPDHELAGLDPRYIQDA